MIIELLVLFLGIPVLYVTLVTLHLKWEIVFAGKYDNKMESSVIIPEREEDKC